MNYHKNIDTLPYWNFLQSRKTGDVRYIFELDSYLDLSKCEFNEEHLRAYANIMEEYNDELLKREKAGSLFDIEKNIASLEAERHVCLLCLSQIKLFIDDDRYKELTDKCILELSNLGYDYNGNIEALEGKIDSILNEIDDLVIAKKGSEQTGSTTSEQMIDAIEQYRKVAIDIMKISVSQYLAYENGYLEHVAKLKNKK